MAKRMFVCECNNEDCEELVPTKEFRELNKIRGELDAYICLKGHFDLDKNVVLAETEHLVLRKRGE